MRRIFLSLLMAASAGCGFAQMMDGAADDPFYRRKTIHMTWIMIWNGSTEKGWWKPGDYNGCKVRVDGVWQSINWNDRGHIRAYFDAIRAAGMNGIVVDFTNGFRWEWQAKLIQRLCQENGMKFAIAFNPRAGEGMEPGCGKIWKTYAAPEAANSGAYLLKDGKPLVVLYTWRKGYEASTAQNGGYRRKFTTVWASGEDSDRDKWGWQVEPEIGPVPSPDSMFLTGSVKFDSPGTTEDRWRRHLSWLDYGFILAQRSRPRYLVVGGFDDVHERNAWMVADTSLAKPGWQMRDVTGALDANAWYERVCDWVIRGKPPVVEGGLIRDGAYRVAGADGRVVSAVENRRSQSPLVLRDNADKLDNYLWFYHLGRQEYRIIKLNAGMPVEAANGAVFINWDSDKAAQRWIARKAGDKFRFTSKAGGEALEQADGVVRTRKPDDTAASQEWSLIEAAVIPK